MAKKLVVISGSVSPDRAVWEKEIVKWVEFWQKEGYKVEWPVYIAPKDIKKEWPAVHQEFYNMLKKADIHFVANGDKKGEKGYIGVGTFAEIGFRAGLNLTTKKKAQIILLKKPSKQSKFYEDITRWMKLGWIEVI